MLDVLHAVGRETHIADDEWVVTSSSIAEGKKAADEQMRNGVMGLAEFVGLLAVPFVGGLTVWKETDNERLGLGAPSRERAGEVVKMVVREQVAELE